MQTYVALLAGAVRNAVRSRRNLVPESPMPGPAALSSPRH